MQSETHSEPIFLKKIPINCGLVIFDGHCIFCNRIVQLLIRVDKRKRLYFGTLASLEPYLLSNLLIAEKPDLNSVYFIRNNKVHRQSEAIIEIARTIGGFWKIFWVGYLIPGAIRNFIYRTIARNRYLISGQQKHCMIPDKSDSPRFLP
ncbi:MAG: DCC1-like thiol-disulfide oxidoreductase family protein [Lentimicrobium sp.]|nr:DUF393 domain-containing protein [Lentimicrobiaceae bacterium]MCO5265371.1 DCC1-like thiol-disulfide oxidoreductase family protein [Lentimicrobium sp.]